MDDSHEPFDLILASFDVGQEEALRSLRLDDLIFRLGSRAIIAKKRELRERMNR